MKTLMEALEAREKNNPLLVFISFNYVNQNKEATLVSDLELPIASRRNEFWVG